MADVLPFRGIRYNEKVTGAISAVICPPYDIISPAMEQELYDRSPYNFIRIEYARQLPQDSDTDNRYTRAAATLEQWLEQGVLVVDKEPAIYVHDHYFWHGGHEYRRRSLVARVRLEDWHRNIVRPHEGTLAGAKSDRLKLLGTLRANTSPIFVMYEDPQGEIRKLVEDRKPGRPVIEAMVSREERHRLWVLTDESVLGVIRRFFEPKPLYIADGHHRYESALNYQKEQRAISPTWDDSEACNFVMMSLVDFDDPGLMILPPHRLLRGLSPSNLEDLPQKLASFFSVEKVPLSRQDAWKKLDGFLAGDTGVRLGLFGLEPGCLWLLSLTDQARASEMMPYFHSELYKRLSVSVVDHVILEELLGLSSEDEVKISYNYDAREAVADVSRGEHQMAIIISPISSRTIKAISDASDRMPRKSTYFYPKLPSGLVLNRLV